MRSLDGYSPWSRKQSDVTEGLTLAFSGDSLVKKIKTTCNAGDAGSIPWSGRSPRERNGNPLQYSCLRNTKDRGAPWATVLGVAKESDMTVNEQQQQFLRHFLKFSHFLISSLVPFLKSSWSCMCASILGVLISFHWSRTSVPSLSIY